MSNFIRFCFQDTEKLLLNWCKYNKPFSLSQRQIFSHLSDYIFPLYLTLNLDVAMHVSLTRGMRRLLLWTNSKCLKLFINDSREAHGKNGI